MRRYRRFGLAVAGLLLLYSAAFTTLAPGGRWQNRMLGFTLWQENDPGGWYLASAHELFWHPGTLTYAGHPGLPMQVLLAVVQNAAYVFGGGPWRSLSYTEFTARHIWAIWWLSKLLATLTHLISFGALYKFARAAGASPRAAALTMASYATSLPVLYYVSRVSVEPWMVLFFLLTFTGLWRHQDAVAEGARQHWRALAWSASAAVSGAFTKFQLLAPLPFVAVALLIVWPRPGAQARARPGSDRWRAAALYVCVSAAALLAYSLVMDWPEFFRYWTTQMQIHQARQTGVTQHLWALSALAPRVSPAGIFSLCELPLLALGATGLVWAFAKRHLRARLAWPAVYALFTTAAWAYRFVGEAGASFHYLFILVAVLSIGFGCVGDRVIARFGALARREVGALVGLVVLLHGMSLWAALDSRIQDVARSRARHLAARYDVLARLRHGQRALIVGKPYPGFHGIEQTEPRPAALFQELEDRLVQQPTFPTPGQSREQVRSMGVRYVLDLNGSRPTLVMLDE